MTLPSSGPLTSNQILAELDRPANSVLNSTDADLIELAGRSDFTIPDDFYGKSALGDLFGTYTVGVGTAPVGCFGYFSTGSGTVGTRSPTTYRGYELASVRSCTGSSVDFSLTLFDPNQGSFPSFPQNIITGVSIDQDNYSATVNVLGGILGTFTFGDGNNYVWGSGDVGQTKTVRIYGRAI